MAGVAVAVPGFQVLHVQIVFCVASLQDVVQLGTEPAGQGGRRLSLFRLLWSSWGWGGGLCFLRLFLPGNRLLRRRGEDKVSQDKS